MRMLVKSSVSWDHGIERSRIASVAEDFEIVEIIRLDKDLGLLV
jgi:hypothetical protein